MTTSFAANQKLLKPLNSAVLVFAFLAVAVVSSLTGCEAKHTGYDTNQMNSNPELDAFSMQHVSYSVVNRLVLQPYCLNCHSNSTNVKNKIEHEEPWLDTFAQVMNNKAAIFHSVFEVKSGRKKMPKGNPMPPKAYQLLRLWIEAGMPEGEVPVSTIGVGNPPQTTPNTEIPTELVTWKVVKDQVFDKACNRCHKADNKWNAVDFNDPENVIPIYKTLLPMIVFQNSMPPREDPPVPLPEDWLADEASNESPNPNALKNEEKVLLYKWFLNDLKIQ